MVQHAAVSSQPLFRDEVSYLDTGDARSFAVLYDRHRREVLAALQAAGCDRGEAEARVGEVFVRFMDRRDEVDRTIPLSDTLRGIAGDVARSSGRSSGC